MFDSCTAEKITNRLTCNKEQTIKKYPHSISYIKSGQLRATKKAATDTLIRPLSVKL